MPIIQVSNDDITTIEEQMNSIVLASDELTKGTSNLSIRKNDFFLKKPLELYLAYMESIKQQIQLMKGYATSYKGFERLNPQDRAKVFMETRFNLICGEGFIHQNDFYVACFNSDHLLKGVEHQYPWILESNTLVERSRHLWKFIQSLNFTKYEASFYLAFLFFSVFDNPIVLSTLSAEGAKYISEVIEDIKRCYLSYIAKHYPTNTSLFEQRMKLMQLAVRLTMEESETRVKTGKRLILPTFNSDDMGTLYYSVINSKVSE